MVAPSNSRGHHLGYLPWFFSFPSFSHTTHKHTHHSTHFPRKARSVVRHDHGSIHQASRALQELEILIDDDGDDDDDDDDDDEDGVVVVVVVLVHVVYFLLLVVLVDIVDVDKKQKDP